jgi:hypothetical protein
MGQSKSTTFVKVKQNNLPRINGLVKMYNPVLDHAKNTQGSNPYSSAMTFEKMPNKEHFHEILKILDRNKVKYQEHQQTTNGFAKNKHQIENQVFANSSLCQGERS